MKGRNPIVEFLDKASESWYRKGEQVLTFIDALQKGRYTTLQMDC